MWLKNIKENRTDYLYWGYLIIVGFIFYIINSYTPLYNDDWHYRFIYGTTIPIDNIYDLCKSQYIHYFNVNGRLIPHIIIQFFDGITGKEIFNIANSVIFILLTLLTIKTINNKYIYKTTTSFILLILFILPGFKKALLWLSGACNYLWVATILLSFNLLIQQKITLKILYPLLFIYGIICGWTHEGLVIGLAIGYLYFYKKEKLCVSQKLLLYGFWIGSLFLVFSPGSINRALNNSQALSLNILDYVHALIAMKNIRVLPILAISLFLLYNKYKLKTFIIQNYIWFITIVISFIFILFTKYQSSYSRFGFEFCSIILLLKCIPYNRIPKYIFHILNITTFIVFLIYIIPNCANNYKEYISITTQIKNNQEIIKTNPYNCSYNRFTLNYITESSDFCTSYDYENPENILIANYFDKERILFLPIDFIKDIHSNPSKYSEFQTHERWNFYAKYNTTNITKIDNATFNLKNVNKESIPFCHRPFAHKMQRYTAEKIEAYKFKLIDIYNKSYIIVSKNPIIDNRIKNIQIN